MEDDEPDVEAVGLYDDDGRHCPPGEIEVPPLCQTCVQRSAEGITGVLCPLSWLDRMLTPQDAREPFSCHAYEKNEGLH